jgi:hypothetical protein
LTFTYDRGKAAAGAVAGESIYGGERVGQQITGGVDLGMTLNTPTISAQRKGSMPLTMVTLL